MKIIINDPSVLSAIRPPAVAAYLNAIGGTVEFEDDGVVAWSVKGQELLVPSSADFGDYASRIYDVIRALSTTFDRSQLEVLKDLQSVSFDVVRLPRIEGADQQYNVPMTLGLKAIQSLHELLLGSAYATVSKRAIVPSRRPKAVLDYMSDVKLSQYFNGTLSYAVLSPLPVPSKDIVQQSLFDDTPVHSETPYGRRVLTTLLDIVAAASNAARQSAKSGTLEPFDSSVSDGVNATVCAALGDLIETDPDRNVSLRVLWSPNLPGPIARGVDVSHPQDPDLYRAASKHLRETAEREHILVVGVVVGLRKEPNEIGGRITIAATLDDSPKYVLLDVPEEQYAQAYTAHGARRFVSVSGTLKREGSAYWLKEPHDFRIATDAPDA